MTHSGDSRAGGCRLRPIDRQAALTHLPEIKALFTETPELPWGPENILADRPGKWLHSRILVDDDEIVGALFTSVKPGRVIWIHAIVVHPARRGSGLSSMLLNEAIGTAEANDFAAVAASVARDNTRSLRSFLGNGFRVSALDETLDQLEVRRDSAESS